MLTRFKSSRPDMISKTLQISVISLYFGGSKAHCHRFLKFARFAALWAKCHNLLNSQLPQPPERS